MDQLSEDKEIIKLEKKLGSDYVRDIRDLTDLQLEGKLLDLAKHRQAIIQTKKNDKDLEAAKRKVSVLNAPYREQMTGNDQRSIFVALVMEERKEYE